MATDPTGRISHLDDMHREQTWKKAVRAATTANITLSGAQTIDGVACVAGDRVLVKNQSTGSQNGIYVVASGAWARAFDMDQDGTTDVPAAEVYGAMIAVAEGTTNAGTIWANTNTGTVTLGSTALTFSQVGGGSTSFGTPALTLGTSNAAGAASTAIRTDATIALFDGSTPAASGGSGATGTNAFAARSNHKHPGGNFGVSFVIDGGGATITTGLKGWIEIPTACAIVAARLFADTSGSIVVDVYRTTYAAYDPSTHPASGDSIAAAAKPTISSAKKSQDTTLTGWTTTLAAGDVLAFNVDSVATLQKVTIALTLQRT